MKSDIRVTKLRKIIAYANHKPKKPALLIVLDLNGKCSLAVMDKSVQGVAIGLLIEVAIENRKNLDLCNMH